jgi:hypothetical protein
LNLLRVKEEPNFPAREGAEGRFNLGFELGNLAALIVAARVADEEVVFHAGFLLKSVRDPCGRLRRGPPPAE